MVALEGHRLFAVFIDRGHRPLTGARQTDSNAGVFALARSIDDAAHDGDRHVLNAHMGGAPGGHPLANVALNSLCEFLKIRAGRTAAAWATGDHRREGTQAHRLQQFLGDDHFAGPVTTGLWR